MWLFVPGLPSLSAPDTAVSNSEPGWFGPIFELWVLWKGKPTRRPSSHIEWSKARWIRVLSGTIWSPSTAARTAAAWISSLPASLARAPASPGSAAASPTPDGCGRSCGEPSSTSAPDGSSSRTSPGSSLSTPEAPSRKSSGTWHRAGGLRNGTASPRPPSAPLTREIVSSCSLPTPTATSYGSSQNGINGIGGANERPSAGRPSLQTTELLPTPVASRGGAYANGPSGKQGRMLIEVAREISSMPTALSASNTGNGLARLNPRFSEWMMGIPEGWASAIFRMDDGDPGRMGFGVSEGYSPDDELHLIGNGVVPHAAAAALSVLDERIRQ